MAKLSLQSEYQDGANLTQTHQR